MERKLPPAKNWLEPLSPEEVNLVKVAEELKIDVDRVIVGLKADRDIFNGLQSESDFLRQYKKRLEGTTSLNQVRAQWAGYLHSLATSDKFHRPYQTESGRNRNIENMFIWNLAHRFRVPKPTE
jgi:hypothetical protein